VVDDRTVQRKLSDDMNIHESLCKAMCGTWSTSLELTVAVRAAVCKIDRGGDTWEKLKDGIAGEMARVDRRNSRSNPEKVDALSETDSDKVSRWLFVSNNAGKKWEPHYKFITGWCKSLYYIELFTTQKMKHHLCFYERICTSFTDAVKHGDLVLHPP